LVIGGQEGFGSHDEFAVEFVVDCARSRKAHGEKTTLAVATETNP
jgi:hypothetical protein